MSFRGFWLNMAGEKLARLKPWELLEIRRLCHKHADIRLGHIK